MLRSVRRRTAAHPSKDSGFTLIELMVVVMIIVVLMAIAVPTFIGAQNKAKERNAQTSVRTTLVTAKILYHDTSTYGVIDEAALLIVEPSLTYNIYWNSSTGPKVVSVYGRNADSVNPSTFYAVAKSTNGSCFAVRYIAAVGTTYAKVTGTCTAVNAAEPAGVPVANWADKW